MPNHVLLDNISHKDLRIITRRSAQYGDNEMCAGVFPLEYRQVQAEYPIVFRKSTETGAFESFALFGLASSENLFLSNDGWTANYIPLTIQRQPFLIGFQNQSVEGIPTENPVVHIDMDSSRVSRSEGEALYLEHGGSSPYLEHVSSVLRTILEGHEAMKGFADALNELQLLEPFTLEVELNDQSKHKLSGFYTINEEQLLKLNAQSLERLHNKRYLEHIYMAVASVTNIRTLIELKNKKIAAMK